MFSIDLLEYSLCDSHKIQRSLNRFNLCFHIFTHFTRLIHKNQCVQEQFVIYPDFRYLDFSLKHPQNGSCYRMKTFETAVETNIMEHRDQRVIQVSIQCNILGHTAWKCHLPVPDPIFAKMGNQHHKSGTCALSLFVYTGIQIQYLFLLLIVYNLTCQNKTFLKYFKSCSKLFLVMFSAVQLNSKICTDGEDNSQQAFQREGVFIADKALISAVRTRVSFSLSIILRAKQKRIQAFKTFTAQKLQRIETHTEQQGKKPGVLKPCLVHLYLIHKFLQKN